MLTHMCYLVLLNWDGIVPTVRRLENLSQELMPLILRESAPNLSLPLFMLSQSLNNIDTYHCFGSNANDFPVP